MSRPLLPLKAGAIVFTLLWTAWMTWWSGSFSSANVVILAVVRRGGRLSLVPRHALAVRAHGHAAAARGSGRSRIVRQSLWPCFFFFFFFLCSSPSHRRSRSSSRGSVVSLLHGGLQRLALGGLLLALAAALVPGVEQLIEPRQHLLDRRQLAGRTGLAARALRPGGPLRTHGALCTGCAPRGRLRPACLADRACPAVRPFRSAPACPAVPACRARRRARACPDDPAVPAVPVRPAVRAVPGVPAVFVRLPRRCSL